MDKITRAEERLIAFTERIARLKASKVARAAARSVREKTARAAARAVRALAKAAKHGVVS